MPPPKRPISHQRLLLVNQRLLLVNQRLLLVSFCLAAWLSACTAAPAPLIPGKWLAADLLALDPPEAVDPGADLIAIYARPMPGALHLRLDLLDFSGGQDADLVLALDTAPGGTTTLPLDGASDLEWDALLVIPASGDLKVWDRLGQTLPDTALRVARSPSSHSIAISLNPASLPGAASALRLQVFSALPGSGEIADQTAPLSLQTAAPQPLPSLLAFWDSFPASTPAQALRRWDGAHTGPFGGRHGLYNLLRTARARQIPLALLDLSSPEALAAVEYGGEAELVEKLVQDRQLALPASLPGLLARAGEALPMVDAALLAAWLEASRESQLAFDLPASPFVFAPLSAAQLPALAEALQGTAGRTIFTFSGEADSALGRAGFGVAARWGAHTLLSLPQTPAGMEADRLDFALEARRALAQAAWDWNAAGGDASRFFVLGGSLPESPFGSPQYARLAFQYLQDHPWIRLLNEHDLQTMETAPYQEGTPHLLPAAASAPVKGEEIRAGLGNHTPAPRIPVGGGFPARHLHAALPRSARAGQPARRLPGAELRPGRSSSLGGASIPRDVLDCAADPDRDGEPECILASERFYAQIELDDGRLALAFARREGAASDAGEAHILVAPGYLLASGLGDPTTWDLASGELADPQVLAGGFGSPVGLLRVEILPDGVRLTGADGTTTKEYRLERGGLAFSLRGPEASTWRLPLVIDPQRRVTPGWWGDDGFVQEGNLLRWSAGGTEFELGSRTPGRITSFRDGEELLGQAENPERELPAGMFLPLRVAVVEWEGSEVEGWLR